jgi:hypothetical protein
MVWGVVAVLVCVLWDRSYSQWNQVTRQTRAARYSVGSGHGGLYYTSFSSGQNNLARKWTWESHRARGTEIFPTQRYLGFYFYAPAGTWTIFVPSWILLFVATLLAAIPMVPWFRWRFSLRTLLIVTAVIAVVLGVVVWFVR